jgi:hypothetical protein
MNIFLSGVRNKLVHDCFLLDEAFSMHAKLKEKKQEELLPSYS